MEDNKISETVEFTSIEIAGEKNLQIKLNNDPIPECE